MASGKLYYMAEETSLEDCALVCSACLCLDGPVHHFIDPPQGSFTPPTT